MAGSPVGVDRRGVKAGRSSRGFVWPEEWPLADLRSVRSPALAGTMTWVGLDVHARSTQAAAINAITGELSRMGFGVGHGGAAGVAG